YALGTVHLAWAEGAAPAVLQIAPPRAATGGPCAPSANDRSLCPAAPIGPTRRLSHDGDRRHGAAALLARGGRALSRTAARGETGRHRAANRGRQEHSRWGREPPDSKSGVDQARALCAEVLGTFSLTLIAAGVDVVPATLNHPVSDVLHYAAPGMTV